MVKSRLLKWNRWYRYIRNTHVHYTHIRNTHIRNTHIQYTHAAMHLVELLTCPFRASQSNSAVYDSDDCIAMHCFVEMVLETETSDPAVDRWRPVTIVLYKAFTIKYNALYFSSVFLCIWTVYFPLVSIVKWFYILDCSMQGQTDNHNAVYFFQCIFNYF